MLCNTKSDRHMHVADMRCAEPCQGVGGGGGGGEGACSPKKTFIINMVFSTFKAPLTAV